MRNLLCMAAFLLVACSSSKQISSPMFAKNVVVAHRGAFKKNGFPENSIAALKEAIRLGCTGSEFDVRMSVDDSLVINHDPHWKGMDIEKVTYDQLSAQKLSNGETMPTLRQYIQAGLENNPATRLVVEIKPSEESKARGQRIAEKTVALIRELKAENKVVYISFDYEILKKIVALEPAASTQYLTGDKTPEQLKADKITGADYHFSVFQKNPQWIESAKANGIALNAWTVNTEADMRWLLEKGFDFITTNEPELLLGITRQ